jgi:lipopolysaccharide/colanic/teichoic acid biosynthesis glycosyltransferase
MMNDATPITPPHGFAYRTNPGYESMRRVVDVVVSCVALVAIAPLLAAAALAIKLDDGGPIFFTQRRVGRFGRLFAMHKLRTMRTAGCGDALKPSSSRDARITRVGAHLRRLSIDELPQLFNVLRGDMTLVGPRPEMPFIVRQYEPWQQLRHFAPPGITGLWQVTCRSTIPLQHPEATALDVEYVRSESTFTDGAILFKTVWALFSARGAY